MDDGTTYNDRVYRTEVYKGTRVTTYKVRWKTDRRSWKEGFRNAALADSFRSSLLTAAPLGRGVQPDHRPPGVVATHRIRAYLVCPDPRLRRREVAVCGAQSPQVDRRSTH